MIQAKLELILKLHKEGKITTEEAITLSQPDLEPIHWTPRYPVWPWSEVTGDCTFPPIVTYCALQSAQ